MNRLLSVTIFSIIILLSAVGETHAQVIRPYSLLYSDNIRGGTTMFGNTITHITDGFGNVDFNRMNETGNPANTSGGLGYSQYGNDNSNIQFADIDGTLPLTSDIISLGSSWHYLDTNNRPTDWEKIGFPDAGWPTGNSELGFGDGDEATIINGGPATSRYMTTYFRKTINIYKPAFSGYQFRLIYDDGAIIYVNGVEVARINMSPTGVIGHTNPASSAVDNADTTFTIDQTFFINGDNTIAVEVHQRSNKSDDLSFNLALIGSNINTLNSSSANLILPGGTNTIKFARLYWGGRVDNSLTAAAPDTLRKVKIRKGSTGYYTPVFTAAGNVDVNAATGTATSYQAYVDITNFVNTNGAGTYTIADIPAATGAVGSGGNYAAWCIVVAYENTALNFNSIRIYDGFLNVYNGGAAITQSVTLTGLNVPNNPLNLEDAVMTSMIWEGDANLGGSPGNPGGDFLKINGTVFSNALNPAANMWNGSISKNGSFVATKNPDYYNQMGIDIDEIQVGTGYGIVPNASSVTIEFGTEADRYYPSLFTFSIRMKPPVITLDKLVADANGSGFIDANEELTYTISGINNGPGIAYNCMITDTLPANVSYITNTMEIVNCPGLSPGILTDIADGDVGFKGSSSGRDFIRLFLGTGATSGAGGQLAAGETYMLRFKVKGGSPATAVTNTARITANALTGEPFVDDGTAIIVPSNGTIPVKLTAFTASLLPGNKGLLQWTTEAELNNAFYEIERSTDGIRFTTRGRMAGAGTTQLTRQYQFTDPLDEPGTVFYYRLKTIDTDGRIAYSKTIALRLRGSISVFSVYPNPFVDNLKIGLQSPVETMATLNIIAADGKVASSRQVLLQKGDNIVVLQGLSPLPKGNYTLLAVLPGQTLTARLVK